jgi:hypothetical protein
VQPGVQDVGISSSLDAPGKAALMIFPVRGAAHNPIAPVIDGLRTRVRESSRLALEQAMPALVAHAHSRRARRSRSRRQPRTNILFRLALQLLRA